MDLSIAKVGNEPRDYRKGNWTIQETMVMIEAKKMDDERRMKRVGDGGGERGKPAELRWKWVEDYCWKNGCFRSQNQCNDKWDNLMRDFKKVKEYQGRGEDNLSYWKIEKNERKEKNLPSNMLPEIYEALLEVTERKGARAAVGSGGGAGSSGGAEKCGGVRRPEQQQLVIPTMQLPPAAEPQALPFSQPSLPTVDSDETSEYSDSPAKRQRRRGKETSTTSGGGLGEIGNAISKIASTIDSCSEREERRHRETVSLHQRRLQIEESKAQINRQGINGLVDAINNLATSILSLAANKNQPSSSK